MKRLISILFITSLTIGCSCKNEEFRLYDFDPYEQAFRDNGIKYYIRYTIIRDTLVKLDSVTISKSGKILSDIALLGWNSKEEWTYDSADRLVGFKHKSDVYSNSRIEYEVFPDKKIIKEIWTGISYSGREEVSETTEIRFNDRLDKIIKKTRYLVTGDSIVTDFVHEGDKLVKQLIRDGDETDTISISYNIEGKIIKVKNSYSSNGFFKLDYVSPLTGLRDSTFHKRAELEDTDYYEYFR
jgi:hypothetical protein